MKKTYIIPVAILLALAFFAFGISTLTKKNVNNTMSQNKIKLIAPEKTGGMPVMEALNKRHSSRNISSQKNQRPGIIKPSLVSIWSKQR